MTDAEIAWLAGLIEGEGTIIFTAKAAVALNVFMTDEDVLLRCYAISGVGTVRGPYQDKRDNTKPIWKWSVMRADDVASLLQAIRPWMGERRTARIDAALDRLTNIRGREQRRCDRGHNNWRASTGSRYCLDCKNDRQRLLRAAEKVSN